MKRITALLFVFALLLMIVAPVTFGVNTRVVNNSSRLSVWADGGGPVPPFPSGLVADGGGPVPPFPSGLVADGGGPVPPFPPSLRG